MQEKLVRACDAQDAIDAAVLVTERGGLGHTSTVYSTDEDLIGRYSATVRTGRSLVNAPTAVGALGGVYDSLAPTFSPGCGTWGGSMTTDNVNGRNLLNLETVSGRRTPPQWFDVPPEVCFSAGGVENLHDLDAHQVLIISDPVLEAAGVVDSVRRHLRTRHVHVHAVVTPEPDEALVRAGADVLERVGPTSSSPSGEVRSSTPRRSCGCPGSTRRWLSELLDLLRRGYSG